MRCHKSHVCVPLFRYRVGIRDTPCLFSPSRLRARAAYISRRIPRLVVVTPRSRRPEIWPTSRLDWNARYGFVNKPKKATLSFFRTNLFIRTEIYFPRALSRALNAARRNLVRNVTRDEILL